MPNYRRARVAGGTYFFTVKTEFNAPVFSEPWAVKLLGVVLRECRSRWPVTIDAIVVMPDHLHAIWTLPTGDPDYSTRWAWIKKEFTRRYLNAGGVEQSTSASRERNRRRGVWQRRFWEHTIVDEDDFERHFDYVHWNPVKHGYVSTPAEWPYSSLSRWVRQGVYPANWGQGGVAPVRVAEVKDAGE